MRGLSYTDVSGYDTNTTFIPMEEPSQYKVPIFLSSIVPALIIFFSSLILIAMANGVRIGRKHIKNVQNKLIG